MSYEGTNISGLKRSFREAVDDYLATCKKHRREPRMSFRGTLNVRVGPELHKQAAVYAAEHGKKLNAVVGEALREYLLTPRD